MEEFARDHLQWLSAEQLAEVKTAYAEGKTKGRERILSMFDATTGATREKAIAQLQVAFASYTHTQKYCCRLLSIGNCAA